MDEVVSHQDRIKDFWRAVGAELTPRTPAEHWLDRIVSNGEYFSRQVDDQVEGAFVWDMGRGMKLWLSVLLPPGVAQLDPQQVTVTYASPAFEGQAKSGVFCHLVREDPEARGLWWLTGSVMGRQGVGFYAVLPNFLQKAESIREHEEQPLKLSGLAISASPSPLECRGGEPLRSLDPKKFKALPPARKHEVMKRVAELLLCPHQGAPTMLRGRVTGFSQTANFVTGAPLLEVSLALLGVTVEVMGPHQVFPAELAEGDLLDCFCLLQAFIP